MSGHTKTCGCGKEAFNLTGQTFGSLTAIKIIGKSTSGDNIWECICSCPSHNIVYRTASYLVQGRAISCGCEKKSKSLGEDKIAILLTGADIPFKREQSFEDLKDADTNGILRFDFFVNNKYVIEYDGIQHFQEVEYFKESLATVQKHDALKNEYCKTHGIPIIRIPYTHYVDIKLEDLLLETSLFII